ncbi:4Fe-4S ferredoxin iron-sulfur binding domain-containing protein [Desulfonema limicola]|uniref:4Fe-4S ferredoxin iron-sulfur binding domain-containing protein n=1 Tax=Desulfonema limicola TaxID=45656 RepID=A0A975BA13_9BACT|nr:4Fe-4S binding protein [Desulfonema limicola]QTA81721.1 4Fe-4S ferredoxin iron-sulfur binding domain-containing protein [Desulfonema limicola]
MAHNINDSSYSQLVRRLNLHPQGAPPSELLFKILKMLFSQKEAELISLLPVKPFTVEKASRIWKTGLAGAQKLLDELADRAILVDIDRNGKSVYVLPPPMAGFFEFSLMRVRNDINQKALSELFYQYLNVEEDFIRDLFTRGETQLGRTFVHEPALSHENALYVLDYERASNIIKTASHRAIGVCYCRHKMLHMNKNCKAPLEICMTFNNSAGSLIKHGFARKVSVSEGLEKLQQAYEYGLVQFGENVRKNVNFICNCCGCCCEALITARRFAILNPLHTTNFIPEINKETCTGCGKCVEACPVEAMSLVSSNNPDKPKIKHARLNQDICLGCGVCVRVCPQDSIHLKSRPKRVITPLDGVNRVVLMAVERGTLQNLIFDNQVLWSHRALAGVLGVILKLPPFKQILANQQLKSRYLEAIVRRIKIY